MAQSDSRKWLHMTSVTGSVLGRYMSYAAAEAAMKKLGGVVTHAHQFSPAGVSA